MSRLRCALAGIAAGDSLEVLAANVDVAPTLLELAGVPVPNVVDGKSLVPLLLGKDRRAAAGAWRTSFISEFAEGQDQRWYTNGMWRCASPWVRSFSDLL